MGEFELLTKLRDRLPSAGARVWLGSGDDAAVTVPGGATATSVDALVEGVHFNRDRATLTQIGRKALGAALSDLAAMGAEAGEAYVALGVPADLDETGCLELLDGILGMARETATTVAGGDVTRAPVLTLAVTVVGHAAAPERLIGRGGAKPGDALVVTGEIGAGVAGLLLLERSELASAVSERDAALLRSRQQEAFPRLAAGQALAAAGARAMIDLSDGLGGDAVHLAEASGVGIRIDAATLPLAAGVAELAVAVGRDPLELAASGGEDYELLAALAPQRVETSAAELGAKTATRLTRVGEVFAGEGVEIRLPGGGTLAPAGFDQLG